MRDRRRAALGVGIAVLVSSVGLIIGLAWVKEWRFSRGTYEITASFHDVGGLGRGDPVSVSGVEKGRVREIRLAPPQGVDVVLVLDQDAVIFDDATLMIRGMGLMGERFVGIDPGRSGVRVQDGARLRGSLESGMTELMGQVGTILGDLGEASSRINRLLGVLEQDGALERTVGNLNNTAQEIGAIATENREDLREAIASFRLSADRLRGLVERHAGEVDTALARADHMIGQSDQLVDRISSLAEGIERLTQRLERGEGTFGKFLNDETLHDDLLRTVAAADSLVRDIREHPGRYLKISVF
jgi:phospholipid/cholesterol/gamma-HCH transport system substrate-binding protein